MHEWFFSSAWSPRDLPVFCKWWHWLCFWSRLVVPGGDGLWGSSWMGESWCDEKDVLPFIPLHSLIALCSPLCRGPMISTPVTPWSPWSSSSVPSVSSTAQPGPKTWLHSWGRWDKPPYLLSEAFLLVWMLSTRIKCAPHCAAAETVWSNSLLVTSGHEDPLLTAVFFWQSQSARVSACMCWVFWTEVRVLPLGCWSIAVSGLHRDRLNRPCRTELIQLGTSRSE